MDTSAFLIALFVVLFVVLVFSLRKKEHITSIEEAPKWVHDLLYFPLPRTMDELTQVEQANILQNMFGDGVSKTDLERERDNAYIRGLPKSRDCDDNYKGCAAWAENGECSINPEYMLYNCASSCQACALNSQEKYNVTYIYNKREPSGCVYHGEDYPSVTRYLDKLYMLS